ncbi:MAG: hypothetical protein ACI91T_001875 [Natronomonas sp.]
MYENRSMTSSVFGKTPWDTMANPYCHEDREYLTQAKSTSPTCACAHPTPAPLTSGFGRKQ